MKLKIIVLIIISQLVILSCEKTSGLGGIIMDSGVELLLVDQNQNDLLSKSTINTLNTDNIRIYYVNGTQKNEVFDAKLDFQRNFKIFDVNTGNVMRLFPNDSLIDRYSTTLIEWNQNDVDTIRCSFTKNSTTLITDSVWYNTNLEYPTNNEYRPRRMFKIVK
jgi:hypothetical protein